MPQPPRRRAPSLLDGERIEEVRLPDGTVTRISPGQGRGGLFGWNPGPPKEAFRVPREGDASRRITKRLSERPRADGAISPYYPNFSEQIGELIGEGLAKVGYGRGAYLKGARLGDLAHDLTPLGTFDDLAYPKSTWDPVLALVPAPPILKRGGKKVAGEVAEGLRGAGRATRKAPAVPARPAAPPDPPRPQQGYANHSWESAPGTNTGHLQPFGMVPKLDYHEKSKRTFQTQSGDARIARGYGQRTKGSFDNVGYYEGEMNPGTQDRVLVSLDEFGKVDSASADAMDAIAATHGLLGAQKGAAWNHFTPVGRGLAGGSNAVRFDLGRPMSAEDIGAINPEIDRAFGGSALILPDERGFRIVQHRPREGAPTVPDFMAELKDKYPGLKDARTIHGLHSSNYIENAWDAGGRFGADYGRVLLEKQIPDIGTKFDRFAPKIAEDLMKLDADTALKHGLKGNEDIVLLRRVISEKGWDGFMKLIENGQVSRAVIPLVFGWLGLKALPQEEHVIQ